MPPNISVDALQLFGVSTSSAFPVKRSSVLLKLKYLLDPSLLLFIALGYGALHFLRLNL